MADGRRANWRAFPPGLLSSRALRISSRWGVMTTYGPDRSEPACRTAISETPSHVRCVLNS